MVVIRHQHRQSGARHVAFSMPLFRDEPVIIALVADLGEKLLPIFHVHVGEGGEAHFTSRCRSSSLRQASTPMKACGPCPCSLPSFPAPVHHPKRHFRIGGVCFRKSMDSSSSTPTRRRHGPSGGSQATRARLVHYLSMC